MHTEHSFDPVLSQGLSTHVTCLLFTLTCSCCSCEPHFSLRRPRHWEVTVLSPAEKLTAESRPDSFCCSWLCDLGHAWREQKLPLSRGVLTDLPLPNYRDRGGLSQWDSGSHFGYLEKPSRQELISNLRTPQISRKQSKLLSRLPSGL